MPVFNLLLSLSLLAGIIFILWRTCPRNKFWQIVFWSALAIKLFCGVLIGWFYNGFGDTFVYQQSSELFTNIGKESLSSYFRLLFFNELPEHVIVSFKTFSNSFFFIKVLSQLNFITGSNYYLNGLFLSSFSFAGCWFLVRILSAIFPHTTKPAISAFLFFPSVVFWNAGLMKDPFLMGSLCFFLGITLKTVHFSGKKLIYFLLLLLFGWLLLKVKFFVAIILFGLIASWLILRWSRKRFPFLRRDRNFLFLFLLYFGLATAATLIVLQKFADAFFYRHLVWNYDTLLAQSVGKPVIKFHELKPEFLSVLSNVPQAVFGTLFRPFIWEGNSMLYRIAGLENVLLCVIFFGSLSFLRNMHLKRINGFYWVLIGFVLIMAALLGLTTPNLGTLNRYRTVFLPFLIYLLLQAPFWQNFLRAIKLKFTGQR